MLRNLVFRLVRAGLCALVALLVNCWKRRWFGTVCQISRLTEGSEKQAPKSMVSAKKCAQQVELLTAQVSQFDAAIADAKTTLELAVKPAPHADGYADSDEGKAQIDQLNKAVDKAEKSKADSSKPGCATRNELKAITGLTGERGKAIDELNSNAEQFNESLGKWRLNKASEQAKAGMDKAKTDMSRLAKMPTRS